MPGAAPADDADPAGDDDAPGWDQPPPRTLRLGGLGDAADAAAEAGYYIAAELTSRGAGVDRVLLNDDRYKELNDRSEPLPVIGAGPSFVHTFETRVDALDAALAEYGTNSVDAHWELVRTLRESALNPGLNTGAVWRLRAPDGRFEAVKTYRLRSAAPDARADANRAAALRRSARDEDPRGYLLDMDLTLRNLAPAARTASFTLQGPAGLPLENEANTRKFRDIELGFLEGPDDLDATYMTAATATEKVRAARKSLDADAAVARVEADLLALQAQYEAAEADLAAAPDSGELKDAVAVLDGRLQAEQRELERLIDDAVAGGETLEEWRQPFRYLGVEAQYFAGLLFPRRPGAQWDADAGAFVGLGEDYANPTMLSAVPQVLDEPDAGNEQFNDVSVRLTSRPVALPAAAGEGEALTAGEATRSFTLFAGPKRPDLLEPLGAGEVVDLGWFGFIGSRMLWFMRTVHEWGLPYWLAIISLTCCVRVLMLPVSVRAARMAAKQKALAPQVKAIKEKYPDDPMKASREQMALQRKYGINPLLGCLPVVFTIPIFIALYNALLNSVDLRLAEFAWVDDLAAPDNTIRLPFEIYYIGRYVNVFPVLLAGLWFFQQKLFMPPAQTPEQEMQFKLMQYMMPVTSLFIYHLPAGWCLYSIASATWTLTERKLLDRTRNKEMMLKERPEKEPGRLSKQFTKVFGGPLDRLKDKFAEAAAAAEAAQKEAQMQTPARNPRKAKAKLAAAESAAAPTNRPGGRGKGRKKKSRRS